MTVLTLQTFKCHHYEVNPSHSCNYEKEQHWKIRAFFLFRVLLMTIWFWRLVKINLLPVLKLFLATIEKRPSHYWNHFFSGPEVANMKVWLQVYISEITSPESTITTCMPYLWTTVTVSPQHHTPNPFICCKGKLQLGDAGPRACTPSKLGAYRVCSLWPHHTTA